MDKPIFFTKHALEKMQERGIDQESVEEQIRNAKPTFERGNGRRYDYLGTIFVIAETSNKLSVITAFKKNTPLEEKIDKIATGGTFWKPEALGMFCSQAYFLLSKGLTEDEVLQHLDTMYKAVAKEYGE